MVVVIVNMQTETNFTRGYLHLFSYVNNISVPDEVWIHVMNVQKAMWLLWWKSEFEQMCRCRCSI